MTGLRAFSLAFLAWHFGLLFPGLAEPAVLAAVAVAGLAGGAATRRLTWWLGLPAGAVAYAVIHGLFTVVPTVLAGSVPSPLDTLPLWADRQLTLAGPGFALAWLEGWAFTGRPGLRGWERAWNAAALVAVFWSQGPYHVTFYAHPLGLALATALFLASELVLLGEKPRRSAPWAAALLVVAAGLGVLWGLLGRYEDQSTASGGGLMKPDLFQFDFAPLVRLEDEITLGDSLVLLYREEGTPRTRYLRRLVLDAWDPAQGFSAVGTAPTVGRRVQTLSAAGTRDRGAVRQEYYLVNLDPGSLLALNEPVTVTPYAQWDRSSFVNAYRVDSLVAGDAVWAYNEQTDDGLTEAQRASLTRGADKEIRALAEAVTRGAVTPFEKASAILQYLREHYYYSLKPGPPGPRGALKHFLFEGKKGYCSYFAFAMTLMLRNLGVPARVAVGFATNPDDAVLGFTPVRAFQAHAWVEVPFGPYGWLDFDPTSDVPAPGEAFQSPPAADPQALSRLIAEILDAHPEPLSETETPSKPAAAWESWLAMGRAWWGWALLAVVVGANEAWRHRWRWRRWWSRTDRQKALVWWNEVVWRARRAGVGPLPGETPEAWAARRGDPELDAVAADASRARYAEASDEAAGRVILTQAQRLTRALDASRPAVLRVLSLLFPWWPR